MDLTQNKESVQRKRVAPMLKMQRIIIRYPNVTYKSNSVISLFVMAQ